MRKNSWQNIAKMAQVVKISTPLSVFDGKFSPAVLNPRKKSAKVVMPTNFSARGAYFVNTVDLAAPAVYNIAAAI